MLCACRFQDLTDYKGSFGNCLGITVTNSHTVNSGNLAPPYISYVSRITAFVGIPSGAARFPPSTVSPGLGRAKTF